MVAKRVREARRELMTREPEVKVISKELLAELTTWTAREKWRKDLRDAVLKQLPELGKQMQRVVNQSQIIAEKRKEAEQIDDEADRTIELAKLKNQQEDILNSARVIIFDLAITNSYGAYIRPITNIIEQLDIWLVGLENYTTQQQLLGLRRIIEQIRETREALHKYITDFNNTERSLRTGLKLLFEPIAPPKPWWAFLRKQTGMTQGEYQANVTAMSQGFTALTNYIIELDKLGDLLVDLVRSVSGRVKEKASI